jgi:hypothetical protein
MPSTYIDLIKKVMVDANLELTDIFLVPIFLQKISTLEGLEMVNFLNIS